MRPSPTAVPTTPPTIAGTLTLLSSPLDELLNRGGGEGNVTVTAVGTIIEGNERGDGRLSDGNERDGRVTEGMSRLKVGISRDTDGRDNVGKSLGSDREGNISDVEVDIGSDSDVCLAITRRVGALGSNAVCSILPTCCDSNNTIPNNSKPT